MGGELWCKNQKTIRVGGGVKTVRMGGLNIVRVCVWGHRNC